VALSVQHSIGGACKLSGVDAHSVAKHDVDMMGSYFHRRVHTASTPSPPPTSTTSTTCNTATAEAARRQKLLMALLGRRVARG
jgi:hypothetical protein